MQSISYESVKLLIMLGGALKVRYLLSRDAFPPHITNLFRAILKEVGFDQITFYLQKDDHILRKAISLTGFEAERFTLAQAPQYINLYNLLCGECECTELGNKISKIPQEGVGEDFCIQVPNVVSGCKIFIAADDYSEARDVSREIGMVELWVNQLSNLLTLTTDPLTQLSNRSAWNSESPEFESGYLFALDLDHFKSVNDTYGHANGDRVLVECAKAIVHSIRFEDSFYRWGGEEFFVYANIADEETALKLAERIRLGVESHPMVLLDGQTIYKTISIGVAKIDEQGVRIALERADKALYEAKNFGRNRYCIG